MKSVLVVLLLAAALVSATNSGGDSDASGGAVASGGGSGATEQSEVEAKPAKAKKASKGGKSKKADAASAAAALPDVPLEAISKLPVEPLAMDAAALKDDDTQFDQFPKQLSGEENVDALAGSLKKAAVLLAKMKRDVEGEKVWTKNVYDIIQNYQYKYQKTVEDVKMRERKISKMERLVSLLKQSTLHSAVEKELNKASKALSELVQRSDPSTGQTLYGKVTARMQKLKNALRTMPRPRELYSDTQRKMQDILSADLPPATGDTLGSLAPKKSKK